MALPVRPDPLANPHDKDLPASGIPIRVQRLGLALFGVAIVASVALSLTEHWRRATLSFGASMLWLAVLRVYCDSRVLGVLAVRSRRFDALYSATIGTILIFLAISVDALGS